MIIFLKRSINYTIFGCQNKTMNLTKHSIIILIFFITFFLNPVVVHSKQKLMKNCYSLQQNFAHNEKIFFEQCAIEELDKAILIKFFVYTYDDNSQKKFWKYHPDKKEFTSLFHEKPTEKCAEGIYKFYIWSNTSIKNVEKRELLDQKYSVLSEESIKDGHNYIEPSRLNNMRLAKESVGSVFIEINVLDRYVYFDSEGYAYVQYCPKKKPCVTGIPDKPEIQRKQGNKLSIVRKNNLPKLFAPTVTIESISYFFIYGYGYVKYNEFFTKNNSIIPSDSNYHIMRFISQGNVFEESPIQCESNKCKCSLPENKSFSIKVIVQVDSSTKEITPVAILNDNNLLKQLKKYSKPSRQEINYYNVINGFIKDYDDLNENSKKEFLFFIGNPQPPIIFPSIPNIPKTLILDEAKGISFCTDTQDICFHKSDIVLNQKASEKMNIYTGTYSNQWDDQFKYYRTPILYTQEYIFQSIENKLFKKYICKSSENKFCYKAEMDKRKFGFWLIIDDFKDYENRFLKILHNFKVSERFYKILLNAHNNKKYRIDRIQGYRIEQIFDIRNILNNSTFPNVSDLEALIDLDDHQISPYNAWELHFILGRNTSKRTSQETKNQIIKRLDDLNVKRIVLWEFSDTRTSEKTIYNQTFEDIQQIKKWKYKYNFITDKNEFNKISIPLYQN